MAVASGKSKVRSSAPSRTYDDATDVVSQTSPRTRASGASACSRSRKPRSHSKVAGVFSSVAPSSIRWRAASSRKPAAPISSTQKRAIASISSETAGWATIQVRHPLPEVAVVPATAVGVPDGPACRAADRRARVGPDVPVVVRRTWRAGILEPRVLHGGVVHHEVHDDLDAARPGRRDQRPEVVVRAVVGLHGPVVGHVVAVVAGRFGDGHQPQGGDPEVVRRRGIAVVQVVQPLGQAGQVADAVTVRVREAANEHLVEDPIGPPSAAGRRGGTRAGRARSCRGGRGYGTLRRRRRRAGRWGVGDRWAGARRDDDAQGGEGRQRTTEGHRDGVSHRTRGAASDAGRTPLMSRRR